MVTLLAFIVLLGVLITAHELGHFIVAKMSGVKVQVFSIGFGRALVSKKIGETEYRISVLPLGGYVKMLGMDDRDEATPGDEGRGLLEKPPFIRVLIAAAGPAMNLILPFVILVPLFTVTDRFEEVPGNQVGAVDRGLPAYKAGMREGDAIVAINAEPVHTFWQIERQIDGWEPGGGPLAITVARDDAAGGDPQQATFQVTPERVEQTNSIIGFSKKYNRIGYQPLYTAPDIAVVEPQGPAGRAGLRTFDRVLSVGGEPVARYIDVERRLHAVPPGDTVQVLVEREAPADDRFPFLAARRQATLTFTGVGPDAPLGLQHAGACVTSVDPEGPAGEVLQRGDCIVGVDGEAHTLAAFVLNRLTNQPGTPKRIDILRDGEKQTVTLQQRQVVRNDPLAGEIKQWYMGLVLLARPDAMVPLDQVQNVDRFAHAWYEAKRRTFLELEMTLNTLAGMFSGRVSPTQLSGPVTIFYLAGEHAKAGFNQFIHLMVLLSLSIALINLLPVPGLDGGQMLVAAVEMVTRRPLSRAMQQRLQTVGALMIFALILFALGNDLVRMWRLANSG